MERRTPLARAAPLRRTSAMSRGTATLARSTQLKPGKRKTRRRISDAMRQRVYRRNGRRCIVCQRRTQLQVHHVLPVQRWPELELVEDGMVGICEGCHDEHERAHRRIRMCELPQCAITLAYATSGAAAVYLERTYTR